ncbi:NADPH-dependent FMN reductase [Parasphingorhabdus sp.]|uniref:NADPH-dependent FMN reductase n=1 Tax=Parasphingorhabdus sp. TaxID=2709688 RepID=UPI003A8D256E
MSVEHEKQSVVFIGGTQRENSSSETALRYVADQIKSTGVKVRIFDGKFLANLRHYDPSCFSRTPVEDDFINAMRECSGVVVATPGYHGSLSGPVKNALDWTEDLAKDDPPYLSGRVFGSIVTAYGSQACGTTLVALRSIAHALRAWPTPMGATINSLVQKVALDGTGDSQATSQLDALSFQMLDFLRSQAGNRELLVPATA